MSGHVGERGWRPGTPPSVYERQFPELQAHLRDAITRYEAAESRVAELEAGIRALADEWSKAGPGTETERVLGRQVVSVEYAVNALRALVGDETTRSETTP